MKKRLEILEGKMGEIVDIVKWIYADGNDSVRMKARNKFLDVVEARNSAVKLMQDVGDGFDFREREKGTRANTNGSVLVESMFCQEKNVMAWPSFWEHLMHLVYITAFGTFLQWSEMWEEYMYLKGMLGRLDGGKRAARNIEKYLLSIKSSAS